ncbi:sugar ABC transporter ATP-binding protein [Lacrimispora sp.]|uniref:sugar ABC transporter ATP-binding protein n=1 Tax=Lacrimispora sp. TaxID=2719234 RepID=UPI0039E5CFE8
MSENIIKIAGVKKYFGGVKALDGVDLVIKRGEVHCLAGENGCGKSTIINVISGFYTPDAGTIEIDGKEYSKLTTQQAIDAGVQVIYQDLSVFPNLTVRENLALNMEVASRKKIISKKRFHEIALQALSKIDFKVDLDEMVENLTVADKQLIAISRALLNNAKLIIMDEPTTAITQKEVKNLFNVIRDLQKQGIAILFVSHKLDEVFEIAEHFTIFRSGKNVFSGKTEELNEQKFTYYMTGREIQEEFFHYDEKPEAKKVLEVKDLSLTDGFANCSFFLREGEILGIVGLLGSGRTELAETIFGYHRAESGEIWIDGKKAEINSVKDGIANGIGYVPPERGVQGLFMDQSIEDNISITKWKEHSNSLGFIREKSVEESVEHWVRELSIKINDMKDNMRTLSGGNAQKCVLAKWLSLDLKVLILNGPTVGVDIGAKYDIYKLTQKLAENGLAIIIISDDIREILSNCNRVLVMKQGRLVEEHMTSGLDETSLSALSVEC